MELRQQVIIAKLCLRFELASTKVYRRRLDAFVEQSCQNDILVLVFDAAQ